MENKEFKLNGKYYLDDGTKVILCDFGGDDKVCITERIYVCEEFEDDYSGGGKFESNVNGRTYLIEKMNCTLNRQLQSKMKQLQNWIKILKNFMPKHLIKKRG